MIALTQGRRTEVTRDLVKKILETESPDEVLLVEGYDPNRNSTGKASRGPLGFGVEAGIALLLPVLWKVIDSLLDELSKESSREIIKKLKGVLSKTRNREATSADPDLVRLVVGELEANGVNAEKAPMVASTLICVISKSDVFRDRT